MRPADLLPMAAAAVTSIMLGASFVAVRWVLAELDPAPLAFMRYVIATGSILPFALAGGMLFRMRPLDAAVIAVLGILQFGVFHMSFNAGLDLMPASRAAVVFSLVPFCTMAIGALLGYETLDRWRSVGVLTCIVGVAVALGEKAGLTDVAVGAEGFLGEGLILVAVVCGSTFNAMSRPYLASYGPSPVVALAMLAGTLYLAPLAVADGGLDRVPAMSLGGWAALLYLGIPIGSFGFFLFTWAIRRTSPTRAAVFLPLSPLSATAFGWWLLDEPITWPFAAGLLLVLGGIWLAQVGAWTASIRPAPSG